MRGTVTTYVRHEQHAHGTCFVLYAVRPDPAWRETERAQHIGFIFSTDQASALTRGAVQKSSQVGQVWRLVFSVIPGALPIYVFLAGSRNRMSVQLFAEPPRVEAIPVHAPDGTPCHFWLSWDRYDATPCTEGFERVLLRRLFQTPLSVGDVRVIYMSATQE